MPDPNAKTDPLDELERALLRSLKSAAGYDLDPPPGSDAEKVREHFAFLERMDVTGVVRTCVAVDASTVWSQARAATGHTLSVPAATATPGGPIRYTWDRGAHHLEAEIPATGVVEWFYRNWDTGETWAADVPADEPLPPSLLQHLDRFTTRR